MSFASPTASSSDSKDAATSTALPFGSYGLSGFGREGGLEQLDSYLETKAVWLAS